MKNNDPSLLAGREASNPAPNTLEGFAVLHQLFHVKRLDWAKRSENERAQVLAQSASTFTTMAEREDGQSAVFCELGQKADLLVIHFRRAFDELAAAERELDGSGLREFLEPSGSYLSVIEIGLYESTLRLNSELIGRGLTPNSSEWREPVMAVMSEQRARLAPRLWPRIPERRYLCF